MEVGAGSEAAAQGQARTSKGHHDGVEIGSKRAVPRDPPAVGTHTQTENSHTESKPHKNGKMILRFSSCYHFPRGHKTSRSRWGSSDPREGGAQGTTSCVSPNTKYHTAKFSAAVRAGGRPHHGSSEWLSPRFLLVAPSEPPREGPQQGPARDTRRSACVEGVCTVRTPEPAPRSLLRARAWGVQASPQVCAVSQGDGRLPHRTAAGRTVAAGEMWESGPPPGRKRRSCPDKAGE